MGKKIKEHLIRRKLHYLLPMLFVAMMTGFYLSFFGGRNVGAVNGVTLTDNDTTGYGLDGRDFTVTWTPGETPVGYENTSIYIVSSTASTTLALDNIRTTGCSGQPCQPRGMKMSHVDATWTLPEMFTTDSAGEAFVTTTYYLAYIFTSSTAPTLVSSTAVSYASAFDTPTDNVPPQIDHISANTAKTGVNAVLYAFVNDDQTATTSFGNLLDSGVEFVELVYGTDVSASRATSTPVYVSGTDSLFSFTVPSAAVSTAGTALEYYILAQDASGNTKYICNDFTATTVTACQTSPFVMNTIALTGAGISISGSITSAGSSLGAASVFVNGFAAAAVSADGSGAYTISSLPTSTAFDITAAKTGYCSQSRYETVTTTSRVGINLDLNFGSCGFFAGGNGAPNVVFSGPADGMQYVPTTEKIRVGLSQVMDATSINDNDASNAGSNVYLTTDDGTTKVAGSVTYCENNNANGCSSLFPGDSNVILFSPSSALTVNTFYTLVIGSAVKSSGGQSISGNRSGGGHQISFTTAGDTWDPSSQGGSYGTGGQFMPPYVRSVVPAPGISAALNSSIIVEFNEAMKSSTINTANFVLYNVTSGSNVSLTSASLDSSQSRFVTLSHGGLTSGNTYEVRVKGAVANASGMTIGDPTNGSVNVFTSSFTASTANDTTAPTIYPMLADASTGVSVNQIFEFGFSEQLSVATINTSNITMRRGTTNVSVAVKYDPGENTVFVVPADALAPNTAYSITFSASVTDLAGNAISATTYDYTTGAGDTTAPALTEVRCDDYTCTAFFSENMNRDSQAGTDWATSVINPANWTLQRTAPTVGAVDLSGKAITYDETEMSATVEGFTGLAATNSFTLTLNAGVTDLSGNTIGSVSNVFKGTVESSASTYGSFGDTGMFGPPIAGGGAAGGMFKPEGFGSFTGEQFMFGQADMAFPFNPMASQDSNVFQTRFVPGQALQTGDIIQLTFPNGTTIDNTAPDTFSPFYSDLNSVATGVITLDTTFETDGVGVSSTAYQVKARITVSGTLSANDPVTLDLRKIVNPAIPKGPETGGYTLGIKVLRAGTAIINKTSMPYFINEGGTNSLTVRIFAGTATTTPTAGANGTIFMFGGGPSGPMDKSVTLTNGAISAVDGVSATQISFASIPNGCYFFGTDPFATLGGRDYFGSFSPEPTCVEGGQSVTKDILFSPAGGTSSVTTTISIVGVDFAGASVDVFAGGPGRFVVKTLSNMGDYSVTATSTSIQLPANGTWFIGVGPAMSKGSSAAIPTALPGVPPSPIEVIAAGVGTASPSVSPGFGVPAGTSFNNNTDTITFTFATADKTVSGTLTDGTNPLSSVEVFMHQGGFGAPVFDTTDNNGAFSLAVSQYGSYEIGAFKDGLPPVFKQIEIKADGSDAGTDPDVYYQGKLITGANPLVITLKKPAYYISGKVLDSSGNGIGYAPVFASNDSTGDFVSGGSGSDGSYTIFVDAGTWTVRSELPSSKSDTCGTLSKSVTVTTANKTSENLSPSISTCYTLSGTISVGGTNLASVPVFVEQWDSANSRPASGGFMKGSSADSNGAYSVKVGNGTYRIGTFHPDYGELSVVTTVNGASVTDANVTVASTATVTFAFTGATSTMNAFVELKDSSDKTKRITKQHNGLNTNLSINVSSGATYNYFIDVFGVGKFSGTVVAGATETVDVSAANYITITGNVKDGDSNNLSGALVSFINNSTDIVETALTDSSGNYSVSLKADTYEVAASLAGYIPGQASQSATFTANTTGYSFGASEEQEALAATTYTIEGTINNSSGTAMNDGYVWATNEDGIVVEAAVDPDDGTYSLPVVNGTWTVEAAGPRHDKTTLSSSVTIAGSSDTSGNNINLSSDSNKTPLSTSGIITANTGGSVNDTDSSGIKLTTSSGVLEAGDGDVTLNFEKSYSAPDSENFEALSNATFSINASGDSTIKELNGNAEIQIDYSSLVGDLPTGVSESDLQLMYYSSERGEYVPVEGGFTIDATNNTITGLVDHFTDFTIVYNPPAASSASSAAASSSGGVGAGPNPPSVNVSAEKPFAATVQETEKGAYVLNQATEVQIGASTHTVTVLSATAAEAKVKIESDPIEVVFKKDESKSVDTDNDNIMDLKGTYLGLKDGQVEMEFINLTDEGELKNVMTINAGAYETNSRDVTLMFNVKNAIQYTLSNSKDFSGLSFLDYTTSTIFWQLTEGNGKKTIYAKFRSEAGGILEVSDTINLVGQSFEQAVDKSETCPLTVGKAYKLANASGVYYITNECTKRPFRNSRIYFSYFDSWKDVTIVDPQVLNNIPNDAITFMPWGLKYNPKGGSLVKLVTDPKVFLLLGTKSYWVTSEALFQTLGYVWNWVEDVTSSLLDKYVRGGDIVDSQNRPENTLIKYEGSEKVYRLEKDPNDSAKQIKRYIKNETILKSLEFREDRIITVPNTEIYTDGTDVE